MGAIRAGDSPQAEVVSAGGSGGVPLRVALVGNPNTGKTTLFNRLTGLRHKTSNFPGTTVEARVGRLEGVGGGGGSGSGVGVGVGVGAVIDLPGIYSLELDQLEAEICRSVLAGSAAPRGEPMGEPSAVCVVADATNLPRSLELVGEVLRRRLPTVVAVNMIDVAERRGLRIDAAGLSRELGCPVVAISARSGRNVEELVGMLGSAGVANRTPPGSAEGPRAWAEGIYASCASGGGAGVAEAESFTDRLDRVATHPVLGLLIFVGLMAGLFALLFSVATYPMELIDRTFALAGGGVRSVLPEGLVRELLTEGVITGIGSTLIFLPQICLLFFVIALLEDTGYLARAAFVADRLLRPFGLPGHSFVPLLSSHACALPGIMAARTIPDARERLATILVAPFMSCSARLPVYALLTTVLFRDRPVMAGVALVGCYGLGIGAAVVSALVARRTVVRGRARPMALELPSYRWPSVRTAVVTTWDRALTFVKNAGTVILCISIVLWWLGAFPKAAAPEAAVELRERAAVVQAAGGSADGGEALALVEEAERLEAKHQQVQSYAGRLGRLVQPVLAPMGYDWQLSIGVIASFAAREVFVSTMAVVVAGSSDPEAEGTLDRLASATRDDGRTPLLSPAVCWSLLVYYVLAMQCLPTLAMTWRETGRLRWAGVQLAWMSGLAYVSATVVYQALS